MTSGTPESARSGIDPRTILAALALLAVCCFGLLRVWGAIPPDLSAVYMAGYLHDLGRPDLIYDAPEGFFLRPPPLWAPYIAELGLQDAFVTPYVYPPMWAVLVAPIAGAVSPQTFFNGVAILEVLLLAASVLLAWRLTGPRAPALWIWLLMSAALIRTSAITTFALIQLQPQIVVVFLILWAFERYSTGRAGWAGALLAIAAALKLAPAGLALIFLLDRNWRALGVFTIACGVLGGVGLMLAGMDLHLAFRDAVDVLQEALFLSPANYSITPLLPVLGDWLGILSPLDLNSSNLRITEGLVVSRWIGKGLFIAMLAWMILRTHRLDPAIRLPVQLLTLSVLLNLFGPLGWIHYYLLPLLLLPALPAMVTPERGYALVALFGALTSTMLFETLLNAADGALLLVSVGVATMLGLVCVVLLTVRPDRPRAPVSTTR